MDPEPPFDGSEAAGRECESALAEQLGRCVRTARGAFSGNTERAVRSDLAIYAGWCAEGGRQALPASPETVAAFIEAMSEIRAPATVRRYVASIAIAHRAVGCSKTLKDPQVRLALQRMHRQGAAARTRRRG